MISDSWKKSINGIGIFLMGPKDKILHVRCSNRFLPYKIVCINIYAMIDTDIYFAMRLKHIPAVREFVSRCEKG